MRIVNKISISFFVASILLSSMAVHAWYSLTKSALQDSIYSHLESVAQSRAHNIETFLNEKKESIKQLSAGLAIERLLLTDKNDSEYNDRIEDVIQRLSKTEDMVKSVVSIGVANRFGIIVVGPEALIGHDRSKEKVFLEGKKDVFVVDVVFPPEDGEEPIMGLVAPINKDNEFLGTIFMRLSLALLYEILEDKTGLGETGETYLVNKEGYMISPSGIQEDVVLKQKIDTKQARLCLEEHIEKGLPEKIDKIPSTYLDYRGKDVLGTHHYIPEMQWCLLAEIDATESLSSLLKQKSYAVILLFIIPLVSLLIGTLIAKRISRPIYKLHKGIEIVGKGNLDYKVGTKSNDEIGQLSRAFDKMTSSLKKTTTSVGSLNREVEERKKTEKELTESRQKFRAIFDKATDGIIIVDAQTSEFYMANKTICEMLGYSSKEIENLGIMDIVSVKDIPEVLATFKKQAEGKLAITKNALIRRKDDSTFYADINSFLITIEGKQALANVYIKDFYGTLLDIFTVSGVLDNQNYSISENSYLLTEASINQFVTEQKVLI